MSTYMVIAKDGKEHGPLDRDTIQSWYREGRLNRNSKVYEPGKHKFRLNEMFDLALWDNPALVGQRPSATQNEPVFMPKTIAQMTGEDAEPTPGMFAAGILLVINGVMGLLSIGAILLFKLEMPGEPRSFVVPFVDLIVAVGLIRGNERFRKWGLVRAVLGGLFVLGSSVLLLVMGTDKAEVAVWADLVFQMVFCVGMAALLWGDWPSKKRVTVGVAAVLVAWSGVITTDVISAVVSGVREQKELAKYTMKETDFADSELGVSVKLPSGWALLTKENPYINIPDAALLAIHNDSGCLAMLMIEPDVLDLNSVDEYLSLVLHNRQTDSPTMKEQGRAGVDFGSNQGRRMEVAWTTSGKKFRGFTTACKAGTSYYLLSGWCLDEVYSKAFPQYQALERAFQIVGTPPEEDSIVISSPPKSKRAQAPSKQKWIP